MRWALLALLLTSCQGPELSLCERQEVVERTLKSMADHFSRVESPTDFPKLTSLLEADYLALAEQLVAIDRMGAKAPLTQSIDFLQVKERIAEHLGRIREMEGGVDWLRQVQRSAHSCISAGSREK